MRDILVEVADPAAHLRNLLKTPAALRRAVSSVARPDSRHRVIKVRCEGGIVCALIQERIDDDEFQPRYRNQLLTCRKGDNVGVIERVFEKS